MKKYQVSRYTRGSARYVIKHAKLQAKKCRNPSEPFKGILNPRLALKAAVQELADEKTWDETTKRLIKNEVATRPRTWRMDEGQNESPTMTFEVVHAEDLVGMDSIYGAYVLHVNTTRGKGFRGQVRCGGTMESTQTFIGTGEERYASALADAYVILEKFLEKDRKRMEEQDRLFHEFHRHKLNKEHRRR